MSEERSIQSTYPASVPGQFETRLQTSATGFRPGRARSLLYARHLPDVFVSVWWRCNFGHRLPL